MKIAVIAKTRLPVAEPFRGGLEAFTHALCMEYIRQGHEITLYAHGSSDNGLPLKAFYGDEHRDDPLFDLYESDEYLSILKDIDKNDFHIVHNNSTHELPILWGATARLPVVTTIHTPPTSKLKAAVRICSGHKNLRFVFPSGSFEKSWRIYLDNDSVVIHNGVDLRKWPQVRTSKDYLFWFGRIVRDKGLDIVLDAAHDLKMPLHFAGSADDTKYFDEEIIPRMRETDKYLGHLQQSEINSAMAGAAVAVSAVRWNEPFGLTNIEAMSSGVPVAGFDRGAFSELIDIDSGVVAEQKNIQSLGIAITAASCLESNNARRRAERFSLEKMVGQYIKYFGTLL